MSASATIARADTLNDANLDINAVVADLRALRAAAALARPHAPRRKLPSPKALARVVDELAAALFPNRLGLPELSNEGVDYFVGNSLDQALRELHVQVRREFALDGEEGLDAETLQRRTAALIQAFASRLASVRRLLDCDVQAAFLGDPAARSIDEVLVCYPGVTAVTYHRLAHELHRLGAPLVARIIAELAHSTTGIDIHPGATIGGSFFIDHGTGVVIGESAVIGERVRLYQAVTLGAKRFEQDDCGGLVKGAAPHRGGRRRDLRGRHHFGPDYHRPRFNDRRQRLDHA